MTDGKKLTYHKVTKAQAALLDWGESHPNSRIKELEFDNEGQPLKLIHSTEDGIGTQLVRFDKIKGG